MSQKSKSLSVVAATSVLTLLLYVFVDVSEYTTGALLISWAFFSWNFYAYGFSSDMWPFQFVELKRTGLEKARKAVFWISTLLYLYILATIAWAK